MTEQTNCDVNTQRGIQPGEVPVNASVGECEHAGVSEREEPAKEKSHAPKVW